MFDKRIAEMQQRFDIKSFEDWQQITPLQISSIHGVGSVTLDHIRLYLAQHECTLKNDATPAFWKKNLRSLRIGNRLADSDRHDVCPFTVLVDSMEQIPFTFEKIKGDSDQGGRQLFVPVKRKALGFQDGRFYQPMGDYSIEGQEGNVHIERKSISDCQSTVLGYGGRRERFERELEILAGLPCSAVVVEGTFANVVITVQQQGKKTVGELRTNLHRSIIGLQQRYRVPWYFCDSRGMAEDTTFRILMRYWRKERQAAKQQQLAY